MGRYYQILIKPNFSVSVNDAYVGHLLKIVLDFTIPTIFQSGVDLVGETTDHVA